MPAIERRLAKLEARAAARHPMRQQQTSLPTLSANEMRVVLRMLAEMGALDAPPPGQPDRWRDLCQALYSSDDSLASDDARD